MKPYKESKQGIKEDKQHALQNLFTKYYCHLCDFVFQCNRRFAVTKKIISDLFRRTWNKPHALSTPGNIRAYRYTAIRNYPVNYLQKGKNPYESMGKMLPHIVGEKYHPEAARIFNKMLLKQISTQSEKIYSINCKFRNPSISVFPLTAHIRKLIRNKMQDTIAFFLYPDYRKKRLLLYVLENNEDTL